MSKNMVFTKSTEYIHRKIKDILDNVSQEDIEKVKSLFFASNRIFVYGAGRLLDGIIADLLDSKNETEESMRRRHATLEQ